MGNRDDSKRKSTRAQARQRTQVAQKRTKTITIIAIAVIAVAIAALLIYPYLKPPFQGFARPQAVNNSAGDPNAPVKVEEFSDFQCPYCQKWSQESEEAFMKKYVETGKVHFTYTPFSFLGPESFRASEAAYCALDQGKFWDYHDILFANQAGENSGAFSDDNLKSFARQIKLDVTKFSDCLTNNTNQQKVLDNVNYAKSKGVNATPYFIVNDGAPIDSGMLDSAVDAALQGK